MMFLQNSGSGIEAELRRGGQTSRLNQRLAAKGSSITLEMSGLETMCKDSELCPGAQ